MFSKKLKRYKRIHFFRNENGFSNRICYGHGYRRIWHIVNHAHQHDLSLKSILAPTRNPHRLYFRFDYISKVTPLRIVHWDNFVLAFRGGGGNFGRKGEKRETNENSFCSEINGLWKEFAAPIGFLFSKKGTLTAPVIVLPAHSNGTRQIRSVDGVLCASGLPFPKTVILYDFILFRDGFPGFTYLFLGTPPPPLPPAKPPPPTPVYRANDREL